MPVTGAAEALEAGGVFGLIGIVWFGAATSTYNRRRQERRAARRAKESELAAVEASLEDPAFAPERIRHVVEPILGRVAVIWAGHDEGKIEALPDAELVDLWARNHHRGTRTRLVGEPRARRSAAGRQTG